MMEESAQKYPSCGSSMGNHAQLCIQNQDESKMKNPCYVEEASVYKKPCIFQNTRDKSKKQLSGLFGESTWEEGKKPRNAYSGI